MPRPKNRYGYSINDNPFECYALTDDILTSNAPKLLMTEYNKTDYHNYGIKLEFTPMV